MDKIKILYACSNHANSKIQLSRFIEAIKGKPYQLKIAAYKKSSPSNVSVDWTLDCLLNIFKPDHISIENENFETYFNQVKSYNPDLIISDLEYFTSYIANVLNITIWQCSSLAINFAIRQERKYNFGLFKQYYYLFHKVPLNNQRIINMLDNSNHNFIYSHLGDACDEEILKDEFEWIRPYHLVGKHSITCKHNIVSGLLQPNKNIIELLKRYEDSVLFTEDGNEYYPNISLKEIKNNEEYICNLFNCNLFLCEGQTSFLADAFYNGKFSVVMINHNDTECIINGIISEQFGYSKSIYDYTEDISQYMSNNIDVHYNDKINFLHERIDAL